MKISKKLLDNIQRFENVINYKFKNKEDVKNYMFNRLKMSEGEIELPDPIIMENDKLMK
ncbi:DUF4300 family protein [Clostridioides difficile]|uniref:DUF4300 family protein n=1 Tax=Clostridioides difficile TaxID=1496 RepID=UPI0029C5231E|nr:DUF4300 family protein [Clostridioides difficile]MDX5716392.1 DUF4300 family protein [Clostridioides difficile]